MSSQQQILHLPSSGRTLSYATYGSTLPTAPTILYFHGFPASHAEAALYHGAALRRGVRIIAPDRPGMGASSFAADRAIADWPRDVLALADALGVRRFAVLGVSGGAPYALACGAAPEEELRERLVAVGVVAGLYPANLGLAGMLPDARALLWVAPWWTGLVRWALEWGLGAAAARAAEGDGGAALEEVLGRGMIGRPEADRRVWNEDEAGFRGCLVESVRGAVPGGSAEGAAREARLFGSDWGFGLDEVEVKGEGRRIVLWHGALDVNSPVAMAEKAAALIGGGAELRVEPDEAHASLTVHKVDEVLDTLMAFFW
ncbi:Alpha beta hydrolase fold protein [Lasiodiplodia theobromae]|uniref:Alpha beta hydrolase fold protein n=1 Tax=Lasiodiplodia theobromae TaxID=45133 RepID=UPI0015C34C39|nr:Alpha beta hydrolase fold protein [Lasiodiplodia theobromae]KAF4539217.1 Alpha beta hydrolase fold protein [Lasiodiplodia theobromae]